MKASSEGATEAVMDVPVAVSPSVINHIRTTINQEVETHETVEDFLPVAEKEVYRLGLHFMKELVRYCVAEAAKAGRTAVDGIEVRTAHQALVAQAPAKMAAVITLGAALVPVGLGLVVTLLTALGDAATWIRILVGALALVTIAGGAIMVRLAWPKKGSLTG